MYALAQKYSLKQLQDDAVELLQNLVSTPSFSKEEDKTALLLEEFMKSKGLAPKRYKNNVWCRLGDEDSGKPVLLLNSHHDTVKPCSGWTDAPCQAILRKGKLTGLGANDAGASLVALLATFIHFSQEEKVLPFDIVFAASAEEEISGANGIAALLPYLGRIDAGIVGEPTGMQAAIAERGLMVLDCTSYGKAGHAARLEGENALYKAMKAIEWFRTYEFAQVSNMLGPVHVQVTLIDAGSQHNVVPDVCRFVVDVRSNGMYSNIEILEIIRDQVDCEVQPRSTRLNASGIDENHAIVVRAKDVGLSCYGSPTLSDQALMPFDTVKIGPGDSARSHTANEFILIEEIHEGIETYIQVISDLKISKFDVYETLG